MGARSLLRGGQHPPPQEHLINKVLEKALRETPGLGSRTALIQCDGYCITFQELNDRADRLAQKLCRAAQRIDGRDFIVAVCLNPSADLIVGLLAIFKIGAAYLPLDPSFPADRVTHILSDAQPVVLLSSESLLRQTAFKSIVDASVAVFDMDVYAGDDIKGQPFSASQGEHALAAVLYTSGSTGIPKGVRLEHRTILQRLSWQWRTYPYSDGEVGCYKTALTFVDSIAEIWAPLLIGVPVQIVPKPVTQDTERFIDLLDRCKVTRLVLVPSLLKAMLTLLQSCRNDDKSDAIHLPHLKMWICSGEVLTAQLLLQFYDVFPSGTIICNYYGSTEVMGDVTYAAFDSRETVNDALIDNKVPIGIPLHNCAVYILNGSMELVDDGDVGEIYVAGSHICSGYVNNREMNRFVANTVDDTEGFELMFRTGDFGRIANGQLYFEGRADSQIKIRGHRVDLNEVNMAINRLDEVSSGVVLCYKAGEPEQEMIAFVILQPNATVDAARNRLKTQLISYMLPKLVVIESLPLLVNGKIDRQKLLQLFDDQQKKPNEDWDTEQLCTEEIAVLKTISSVVGACGRAIQLSDNFFDLGGNSLNAVAAVTKLRDQGFDIDMASFLRSTKLSELISRKPDDALQCPQQLTDYVIEMLSDDVKDAVIKIICTSFSVKAELELLTGVVYEDYDDFMNELWDPLVAADLSFVVKDLSNNVLAVALNFDVFDEPVVVPKVQRLSYVFEFLESIEAPVREKYFEKRTNSLIHSFMMGTVITSTPAENVVLIQRMEEETLALAKRRHFSGVFTTNTNELTRQVCDDLLGYQVLYECQVNQFVASDGTRPFASAPESQCSAVTVKYIN